MRNRFSEFLPPSSPFAFASTLLGTSLRRRGHLQVLLLNPSVAFPPRAQQNYFSFLLFLPSCISILLRPSPVKESFLLLLLLLLPLPFSREKQARKGFLSETYLGSPTSSLLPSPPLFFLGPIFVFRLPPPPPLLVFLFAS